MHSDGLDLDGFRDRQASFSHDASSNPFVWLCGVVIVGALGAGACERPAVQDPVQTQLRFRSGSGSGFSPLGNAIVAGYRQTVPNVEFEGQEAGDGALENAQAIQQGAADIGLVFANVAYLSFIGGLEGAPSPFDRLRGIAVLGLTPLHLIARPGARIEHVSDLRARRVATGRPGSDTELLANLVMKAYGIDSEEITREATAISQALPHLLRGTLDAAFSLGGYPGGSVTQATSHGAILIDVAGPPVDALRSTSPFVRPTFIPGGTYPEHPRGVLTVGVDNLLVCRADLSDQLVYELTKGFFEALPEIVSRHPRLRFMDIERAPATAIPLHDGAARYYREQELR
jgi:TRAP transporter TAXI family solute receptor